MLALLDQNSKKKLYTITPIKAILSPIANWSSLFSYFNHEINITTFSFLSGSFWLKRIIYTTEGRIMEANKKKN